MKLLPRWDDLDPQARAWARRRLKIRDEDLCAGAWQELRLAQYDLSDEPAGVREFIESPRYLDKRGVIWPRVMEAIEEVCSGDFDEAVLTGGIGCAKTTVAEYATAYQIYLLSMMRDPHAVFDLDRASEITFIFQSVREGTARAVDYDRFRALLDSSPYFRSVYPYDQDRRSEIRFLKHRVIAKPVASLETSAIGENVIGGVIDEINFMQVIEGSRRSIEGGTYDQAVQNYNAIARRRQSRFMRHGAMPGILFLVSSRRYPGQFTDRKEEQARRRGKNSRIYLYDRRVWEVKPEGTYSAETFSVFIGDQVRKPYVLTDSEREERRRREPERVKDIPVDFRDDFEDDIYAAIRDIAGVAVIGTSPFFPRPDVITAAFSRPTSVFSTPVTDFVSPRLRIVRASVQRPREPRWIHVDLALTGDSAGLAVGHVQQFVRRRRRPTAEGADYGAQERAEVLPLVYLDGVLEVRPPPGGEINFEKVRGVIYTLAEAGVNVQWVSFDSFQSADSMQILRQRGFRTGYQSVDRAITPYSVTKSAMNDGRVDGPYHEKAIREFRDLVYLAAKEKVEHTPTGSKDLSDAVAGVVYGLSMRREIWARHGVSPVGMGAALGVASATEDEEKEGALLLG